MIRIGIDIGGTFTDFAIWRGDAAGYTALGTYKVPSTPPRYALGVIEGLEHLIGAYAIDDSVPVIVVHGTTVGTNTVIERTGSRLALLTTAGFRDILGIARLRLDKAVDLFNQRVVPLIPRERVHEIAERTLADGAIDTPIDLESVRVAARAAAQAEVDAIAVCFLHSYRNPAHELAAAAAIREVLPGMDVVMSHDVWPQQSEYERAVVTLLNAFVRRKMGDYIGEIERYLAGRLKRGRLFITRSNGGVMAASEARNYPVHTLLSGPAAGVTAGKTLGSLLGIDALLTMDMGGTSTDMSLIRNGESMVSAQAAVGDFPLMMPVTAIEAIGAGGGSIAWLDGPVLKVGPQSAGANPGPACYGRGGTEATLSDAYLLCGYLGTEGLLGGRLPLSLERAQAALQPIAERLKSDPVAAAESCLAIASSNMLSKVLPFLARLGVEPSELTLMIFGGAGGIHGPLLADEVGIRRIVVPRWPSVFCAYGCLVSDLVQDTVETVQGKPIDAPAIARRFDELRARAEAWLDKQVERSSLTGVAHQAIADMRYTAQSFTVSTDVSRAVAARGPMADYATAFHAEHMRLFGHNDPDGAVAFNELRLRLAAALPKPGAEPVRGGGDGPAPAPLRHRRVRYDGRWHDRTAIYARDSLPVGWRAAGLAIIEQDNATILVPPGFTASVGPYGDLVMVKES
ncbi:MAG: hydantoinase/oxoprolinase family protein [Alphaproteobacteria bacterium]|nr:hydantoinase/oxoprolinase family protein [Alphaproteobacteria bacterium]